MLEVSSILIFVLTKPLCWGPWHTFLGEMGRSFFICRDHFFTVEVVPPTDGHQEFLHQAWMLPFQPHCETRELPRFQAWPRRIRGGPWSSSSRRRLTLGTICWSPWALGPTQPTTPTFAFLNFHEGIQNRYRLQHKLKNIHLILPWSWQEAGWEYATERKKWPCQILQFPKSRRDLVGAPELTAYQTACRDGSVVRGVSTPERLGQLLGMSTAGRSHMSR